MNFFKLLVKAMIHWKSRDADLYAGALAYYAPFAIIPLLALSILLIGFVVGPETYTNALFEWGENTAPELSKIVSSSLAGFEIDITYWGIPMVGIFFLVWIVFTAFGYIVRGIHNLWYINNDGLFRQINLVFRTIALFILLILYLTILVILITYIPYILPAPMWQNLLKPLSVFLITVTFFTLMYKIVSKKSPRLISCFIGALVVAFGIMSLRIIVSWWIAFTPAIETLGPSGVLLGLLLWVYTIAILIYYGASVAYIFDKSYPY